MISDCCDYTYQINSYNNRVVVFIVDKNDMIEEWAERKGGK